MSKVLMQNLLKSVRHVLEYQSCFEWLSNQAKDWTEKQLVDVHQRSLSNICCEVKAHQPCNMITAIYLQGCGRII